MKFKDRYLLGTGAHQDDQDEDYGWNGPSEQKEKYRKYKAPKVVKPEDMPHRTTK